MTLERIEVKVFGINLKVAFFFRPGIKGSFDEEPVDEILDIAGVFRGPDVIDIFDLLSQQALDEIRLGCSQHMKNIKKGNND